MRPQNEVLTAQVSDGPSRVAYPELFNMGDRRNIEGIAEIKEQIKLSLLRENAVIIAHYYTDRLVQELAEELGGVVSDSLEMARYGKNCDANFQYDDPLQYVTKKEYQYPHLSVVLIRNAGLLYLFV